MICERCFGRGIETVSQSTYPSAISLYDFSRPCPECHGSGRQSCCDAAGAGIAEGGEPRDAGRG